LVRTVLVVVLDADAQDLLEVASADDQECLDWILIWGRRHLERVLDEYLRHYNDERPNRSLDLRPPRAINEGSAVRVARTGTVASAATASEQRDCQYENSPPRPAPATRSAFAGFRFPPDVIVLAVRWYLRFGLSYRDVEELLAERGVEVDHVTVYRWVLRFTPLLADAARPCRHAVGDRWSVDET
jgi:hypothetical protein